MENIIECSAHEKDGASTIHPRPSLYKSRAKPIGYRLDKFRRWKERKT